MQLLETTTRSESETFAVAERFAEMLRPGDNVLFYGELGAGKTAFIRSLVRHFGAGITVTSPTFALINVYPTQPPIYHFDLYRLSSDSDLTDLGFDEYLESAGIVLVEWAEKCRQQIPTRYYSVRMQIAGESERAIKIERSYDDDPRA
jgi:tRNA threonylcarbamoyladenosine biosynthesis protein TsaE